MPPEMSAERKAIVDAINSRLKILYFVKKDDKCNELEMLKKMIKDLPAPPERWPRCRLCDSDLHNTNDGEKFRIYCPCCVLVGESEDDYDAAYAAFRVAEQEQSK